MDSITDIARENLLNTYKMFSASQGIPAHCPKDLTQDLLSFRAQAFFSHDRQSTENFLSNQSKSSPSKVSSKSLEALLESSSSNTSLLQNKYLSLNIKSITPTWRAPWKLMRVISGHQGWVRTLSVDPSNTWFASGSNDRMIKIWDLATGQLKLSLVGHINAIRSVVVSDRHPYLFSCSEDKKILCWDLEQNKVVRHYHGHLSGIYTLALHPSLDVLLSGSRDTVCRVWDIRTKAQVRVLEGHSATVFSVTCQDDEPQVISGSADATVRLWDLRSGNSMQTLTRHKKSIRKVKTHHQEYTFISAGADDLKLWKCPDGVFLRNFLGHQGIVNDFDINHENLMVTAADDGSLGFWDYDSGFKFQEIDSQVQPGSLSSEAGIFSCCFDRSGLRMITAECDKTIKIWKEDENATPDTHPFPKEAKYFIRTKF
jgi:pleiotropic regulator 1